MFAVITTTELQDSQIIHVGRAMVPKVGDCQTQVPQQVLHVPRANRANLVSAESSQAWTGGRRGVGALQDVRVGMHVLASLRWVYDNGNMTTTN